MNFYISDESSNTVVLWAASALIMAGTYLNLIFRTNLLVATYAFALQFVAAILIFVILVILITVFSEKKKKRVV